MGKVGKVDANAKRKKRVWVVNCDGWWWWFKPRGKPGKEEESASGLFVFPQVQVQVALALVGLMSLCHAIVLITALHCTALHCTATPRHATPVSSVVSGVKVLAPYPPSALPLYSSILLLSLLFVSFIS